MCIRIRARTVWGSAFAIWLVAATGQAARAQEGVRTRRQVITGLVEDSAAKPLTNGDVMVTVGRTFDLLRTTTDSVGRFRVVIEAGTGDYLVAALVSGFQTARLRAVFAEGQDSLTVRLTLAPARATSLEAMRVSASRPRPRDLGGAVGARGGAAEVLHSDGMGVLAAADAGDLNRVFELDPSLTSTASGMGALGFGPAESRVTLNGMPLGVSRMPGGMRRRVYSGVTSFDPADGGFSGALQRVELRSGSGMTSPTLRLSRDGDVDGILAAMPTSVSGQRTVIGYASSGEAVPDRFAYNTGIEVRHSARPSLLFGTTSARSLRDQGVSSDVIRSIALAAPRLGIPFSTASESDFPTTELNAMARFDRLRGRWAPIAMTTHLAYSSQELSLGALANATRRTQARSVNGGLQLSSRRTTAGGSEIDWRIGATISDQSTSPLVDGPAIDVRVDSDSGTDFLAALGGAGSGRRGNRSGMLEAAWQIERVVVLPGTGTHQFKLFAQHQSDVAQLRQTANSGVFTYASYQALESGSPQSYERNLDPLTLTAGATNFALGIGDVWRPSRFLTLQLGLRIDAGQGLGSSAPNAGLRLLDPELLTVRGSRLVPALSPRLGFHWTYRKERAEGAYVAGTAINSRAFPGAGHIRGGVGLFRDYWTVNEQLTLTRSVEGMQVRSLSCGVRQVPPSLWFEDAGSAPLACADSSSSVSVPGSTTLARGAMPSARWTGNLVASHAITKKLTLELGLVLSYGRHLRTMVDRNLPVLPSFVLSGEGARASFRPERDIDTATGFPLRALGRPIDGYDGIFELRTDGQNRSRQLTLGIMPELPGNYQLQIRATYERVERFGAGLDETGSESIAQLSWRPATLIPRWRSNAQFGWVGARLSVLGLVRSEAGARYTPLVSGDVNGDGRSGNDRAFVDTSFLDTKGAAGALSSAARDCLATQAGRIASVGSCVAPAMWTADLAIGLTPRTAALAKRGGGRISYMLRITNLPALLDRLFNSSSKAWGAQSRVDPVLATVQGYDRFTSRFIYQQNANFGRPALHGSSRFAPYRINLSAQVFLGSSVADQQAKRALWRSHLSGKRAIAPDSLVRILRRTYRDPFELVLAANDSLLLDRNQVERIQKEQRALSSRVDSLWYAIALKFTAKSPRLSDREAGELLDRTYQQVVGALQDGVEPLRSLLYEPQLKRLPGDVVALLARRRPTQFLR